MLTFAALIQRYIDKLLDAAFPYVIIAPWEQGVRTFMGRVTKHMTPTNGVFGTGLHFYWPILGTSAAWECNTETWRTSPQTFGNLTLSFIIQARIARLDLWFVGVNDPINHVVGDQVSAAAGELAGELNGALPSPEWCEKVRALAQRRCYGWGVEIKRVAVETATCAPTLRLIGADSRVTNFNAGGSE